MIKGILIDDELVMEIMGEDVSVERSLLRIAKALEKRNVIEENRMIYMKKGMGVNNKDGDCRADRKVEVTSEPLGVLKDSGSRGLRFGTSDPEYQAELIYQGNGRFALVEGSIIQYPKKLVKSPIVTNEEHLMFCKKVEDRIESYRYKGILEELDCGRFRLLVDINYYGLGGIASLVTGVPTDPLQFFDKVVNG